MKNTGTYKIKFDYRKLFIPRHQFQKILIGIKMQNDQNINCI